VGTEDAIDLALTLFVVFVPFELLTLTAVGAAFPRTGLVVAYFPILSFLAAQRILVRVSLERRGRRRGGTRYLIVGSGDTVEVAIRELGRSGGVAVGVVSLAKQTSALSIRGCPQVGHLDELKELVPAYQVGGLILAGLEPAQNAKVMNAATDLGLQLRTLPAVSELLRGEVEVNTLRPLQLEDLLEREPITFTPELLGEYLGGQVVLVTGAGGSIGAEITRQIVPYGPKRVVLLGRGENSIHEILNELTQTFSTQLLERRIELIPYIADVRDRAALQRVFALYRPTVVFHAAAHKHVPLMEAQPIEACSNNVFGTLNLMDLCSEHQVKRLVVLSTDKAVDPSSVMGATKRVTELLVHTRKRTGFTAVRFGNVLGSRGSVVPTLQKQIERGGPVTITDPEMSRYFMTIPEAVSLVLAAGATADGGEIYVLEMGNPLKIVDLAENLIRLSGLLPHKDIEFVYSGVRPGEKLSEELVYSEESSSPSGVKGMVRVTPKRLPENWPGEHLEKLAQAVESGDEDATREHLFALLD
jgi:FlaA1/EpsC-like NDP-sugar epimerase